MKIKIGVMGSALERGEANIPKKGPLLAYEVGKAIAEHKCIFVNGACGGIPHKAAQGARDAGGYLIGISPAENFHEHVHTYKFPYQVFDVILYTGFGFKGRNVVNVSNCDAVIVISGHMGTLNEFSIAYDEGMVVGVMQGSGGIADEVQRIIKIAKKKTGAVVVYDKDPHSLVKRVIREVLKRQDKERKKMLNEVEHNTCYRCT